jgi:GntR family transcriptional regulator, galactonate operon transcriptional repressor
MLMQLNLGQSGELDEQAEPMNGPNPMNATSAASAVHLDETQTDAASSSSSPLEGAAPLRSWPRRPPRLATAVVEDLVDRIVGGELPVGSALPIEPVLCEMFAVSRTVIREAVKSLEAMRLVTVQQGLGTTVRDAEDWDLLDPVMLAAFIRHDAELAILEDLVDVRRALEGQMAGQAALRVNEEHLSRIRAALERVQAEEQDEARFLRADLDFHYAIMNASGNRLGRAVIQTVNAQAFHSLRYIGESSLEDLHVSNLEHQAIFDRIVAKDEQGAGQAMNDHILGSWIKRRPDTRVRR